MHLFAPFTFSLLAILVSAVPTNSGCKVSLTRRATTQRDGVVDVGAVRREASAVEGKLARGMSAYERNTGSRHPLDRRGMVKRGSGLVPLLDDLNETFWEGTIAVGTPPRIFRGSSDTILPGVDCDVNCDGHKRYDPSASSTSYNTSIPYAIPFGDGSLSNGTVFTDTVTVAGLTAMNQAIGDSSTFSNAFNISQFPPDGVVGLAFPSISKFNASPIFHSLISQGAVDVPEFGIKLAKTDAELFLGGVNTSLFTGEVTQVPVTQEGFWEINVDSIDVSGEPVLTSVESIVDSSVKFISGPKEVIATLYDNIPGSRNASDISPGIFTVPCNTTRLDVAFTFNGRQFPVSWDTFNQGPLAEGSEECVGGAMVLSSVPFLILGEVFMQNVYTIFDVGNSQVGFATLA
ncbi:acid protease [Vararia minispora EC-137]|uniref:Acid protease n=1 Tax=Vararia minispora EC-137 TaxID=1314806 RepID=A0ACB8QWL1_9AGAM|nr:acid protease [Vararia minispora EC-137]